MRKNSTVLNNANLVNHNVKEKAMNKNASAINTRLVNHNVKETNMTNVGNPIASCIPQNARLNNRNVKEARMSIANASRKPIAQNDIAASIDAVIERRKEWLPKIKSDISELQNQVESLRDLLNQLKELSSIEKDPDANKAIRVAVMELKGHIKKAEGRIAALSELKAAFSRDTLNIGVSGEIRSGKSTTLQKISGLTDQQIPTGSGLPVTAVRSEIYNDRESRVEVVFRTEREFVTDYLEAHVQNLNSALPDDQRYAIDSLAALRKAKLPRILSGESATSAAQDSLKKLQQAQRGIESFRSYLGRGSEEFDLSEGRKFVAYPTDVEEEEDERGGDPASRAYLAVKNHRIYCQFPSLGNAKIALTDLPGLGEVGASVAKMHLKGLEDKVDQILLVVKPTSTKGTYDASIASNLDQLRQLQPGVRNRADLVTLGINVEKGLDHTANTLEHSLERELNSTLSPNERFDIQRYCAIDSASAQALFSVCLRKLAERQPEMDRQKIEYVTGGDIREGLSETLNYLQSAMAGIVRKIPTSDAMMKKRIDKVARGIIQNCDGYEHALNGTIGQSTGAKEQFDLKVKRAHDRIAKHMSEDLYMLDMDDWRSSVVGSQDLYSCYRAESRRLRREVINEYKDLEIVYSSHVESFKQEAIGKVLCNLGRLPQHLGLDCSKPVNELITQVDNEFSNVVGGSILHDAFTMLLGTKFDFVGNMYLKIEKHLIPLENPKDDSSAKQRILGQTGDLGTQIEAMRKYLQADVKKANDGIQQTLLVGRDEFNHYLAVSMAFFNDYLYRRDEDTFKQVVVRGLVREYSGFIFSDDGADSIDPRKRSAVESINQTIVRLKTGLKLSGESVSSNPSGRHVRNRHHAAEAHPSIIDKRPSKAPRASAAETRKAKAKAKTKGQRRSKAPAPKANDTKPGRAVRSERALKTNAKGADGAKVSRVLKKGQEVAGSVTDINEYGVQFTYNGVLGFISKKNMAKKTQLAKGDQIKAKYIYDSLQGKPRFKFLKKLNAA